MPRPKKDATLVAKDKTLRSQELRLEQLQQKLHKAIDAHPSKAQALWSLLGDLGIDDLNYDEPEKGGQELSQQKRAQMQRKLSMHAIKASEAEEAQKIAEQRGAKKPLSSSHVDLARLTVPMLQELLASLAGSTWSRGNLNVHARMIGKPGLLQMIEFATGMEPDSKIWDTFVCLVELADHMKELYLQRGSRGAKCPLPLDWSVRGLFLVVDVLEDECVVIILHRFTREKIKVPISETGVGAHVRSHRSSDDYNIVCNWSEMKATVVANGCKGGFRLGCLGLKHAAPDDEIMIERVMFKRQRGQSFKSEELETPPKKTGKSGPDSAETVKGEAVDLQLGQHGLEDATWDDADEAVPARS